MLDSVKKLVEIAIKQRDEITTAFDHDQDDRKLQEQIQTFESGRGEGWCPVGQVGRLISQWQPRVGYGEFEATYQHAKAEAIQSGLGAYLLPKLNEVFNAHQTLLRDFHEAAMRSTHKSSHIMPLSLEPHCRALSTVISDVNALPASQNDPLKVKKEPTDNSIYMFKEEGATYRVRFDGEEGTIHAKLKGAKIIYELLQHPNRQYQATDLMGAVQINDNGKADQQQNKDALKKCWENIADINARMESVNCEMERQELETEKEKIIASMNTLKGLGGKAKKTNPNNSARVSVHNRVEDVKDKCRQGHLARFADHLDKCLETGSWCSYRPEEPPPNWNFF